MMPDTLARHHTLLEAFAGFGAPFAAAALGFFSSQLGFSSCFLGSTLLRAGWEVFFPVDLLKDFARGLLAALEGFGAVASVEGLFEASGAEVSGAAAPAEQGIAPFRESVASLLTGTRQRTVRWSIQCDGAFAAAAMPCSKGPAGLTICALALSAIAGGFHNTVSRVTECQY